LFVTRKVLVEVGQGKHCANFFTLADRRLPLIALPFRAQSRKKTTEVFGGRPLSGEIDH